MASPGEKDLADAPPPGGRPGRVPRNVVVLGLVSLLTDASSEMVYPVLPLFLMNVLHAPVSAIGLIESLLTLNLIDDMTQTRGKPNRACVGQGIANVATGLFGGMGGCAMIGQSMINVTNGAVKNISGIAASLFLLSFILFASKWIEMIPLAALIGVMFVVSEKTFEWGSFRLFGKVPKADILVGLTVAIVTVLTDLAIAVIVGVLALVLRSESGARKVGHLAERVVGPVVRVFRRSAELDLVAPLLSFRASSVEVVTGRWVLITVSNLAMQLTSWLVLFVGLRAVEVGSVDQVTWSQSLAAFSLARIASFIPLTPGGLGTVDLALSTLLVSFGATNDDALAATLLWRAGTYFPPMITGMVTFLVWRVHQRRAARAA